MRRPSQTVNGDSVDQGIATSRPPQFGRRKTSADMQRPDFFGSAPPGYEARSIMYLGTLNSAKVFLLSSDTVVVNRSQDSMIFLQCYMILYAKADLLDKFINYTNWLVTSK